MSEGHEVAYREIRLRIRDVVTQVDASALEGMAPATPKWRAHDVLAHLVGVPEDVVNGRLDGLASDAWTQAQVDRRRSATAEELLDEWDACSPQFEVLLAGGPAEMTGQAIFDAATHELDLLNALGIIDARDSAAVGIGWDWITDARTRGGAPAICYVVESGEQISGMGDLVARIEAPRFELFRAVAGRRTADEIAQYGWDREPDASLLIAADFFSLPAQSIGE